jgi:hypothetical protein
MKHPLLNPNSKHYDDDNGKPTIIDLEQKLTLEQMIGACLFNIYKYEARKDKKGQRTSDEQKIITYRKYLEYLLGLERRMYQYGYQDKATKHTVKVTRKILKEPKWEY